MAESGPLRIFYVCLIGDGLRFQTDGRQATEVAIAAADVLNRMLELGRPEYVRIA